MVAADPARHGLCSSSHFSSKPTASTTWPRTHTSGLLPTSALPILSSCCLPLRSQSPLMRCVPAPNVLKRMVRSSISAAAEHVVGVRARRGTQSSSYWVRPCIVLGHASPGCKSPSWRPGELGICGAQTWLLFPAEILLCPSFPIFNCWGIGSICQTRGCLHMS